MKRSATPKLGAYAGLAALGLLAALALRRAELVAAAAPFLLVVGAGLVLSEETAPEFSVELDRERVLEGEEVELTLRAEGRGRMEVLMPLPDGLELVGGENPVELRLPAERRLRVRCVRWGAYRPGIVFVRAGDRLGVIRAEGRFDRSLPLRVYPAAEQLRSALRPLRTQVFSGNQVARQKGEGIEFADVRQFVPGDRIRRVNWRASARRGELWVNEQHTERNTDVVLLLDSFAQARGRGDGTAERVVRAAAALAEHYLGRKDRVGIAGVGGVLSWLVPGSGLVQLYRIVDSLIENEVVASYAWRGVETLPRRLLPPQALVIGLTPLLDERGVRSLLDLRGRGYDVAAVEISPLAWVAPGARESDKLAHRIWLLTREANRGRLQRAGIPISTWSDEKPFSVALEEVSSYRRQPIGSPA